MASSSFLFFGEKTFKIRKFVWDESQSPKSSDIIFVWCICTSYALCIIIIFLSNTCSVFNLKSIYIPVLLILDINKGIPMVPYSQFIKIERLFVLSYWLRLLSLVHVCVCVFCRNNMLFKPSPNPQWLLKLYLLKF